MKQTETLKKILDSFEPYPNLRLMLFSKSWGELEEAILEFCKEREYQLLVYKIGEFETPKEVKTKSFNPKQPKYNQQGRLYNYIFIHYLPESLESLSKKIFSSIANGGRVYLLLELSDSWEEIEIFEKNNYVSINKIELDNKSCYTTAKKMHGWGS